MISILPPLPGLQALYWVLYLLIAVSVTVDVLLTKSDVRGALGWIGAAWFAPFLGGLVYFMFGINRVARRALKMGRRKQPHVASGPDAAPDAPEHISQLFGVGARVTGSPLLAGNQLTVLENGDQAYPMMLAAIAGAKRGIVFSSYIFRNDAAGRDFVEALVAARGRGVEVRVLLDGVGLGYFFSSLLYRLRAGGVTAARFLHTWLPWRMPFLNMRNHRKFLVVDGALGFVGGINIGAENTGHGARKPRVTDVHFQVEGPAVRLIMDSFARDWAFTTGENLNQDFWWPALAEKGGVYARGISAGPDADIYKIELMLGAALTLAKKRIRIVTPYFLPESRLQFAIAEAGLRGVEVEIVLPRQSDHAIMQWAMRAHLRFFNHIAVRIFTTPPPFDHAKLCTVDGCWSLIGSSNWDSRSFRLNFEFDLECYDPKFTKTLDDIIDARIARGRKLDVTKLTHQPMAIRLRDAAARLMLPYL